MENLDTNSPENTARPITYKTLLKALTLDYCSVLPGSAVIEPIGNSLIVCSQWFPIVQAATCSFPDSNISEIKIGLNFVTIEGPRPDEPLHIHISSIIGIVTSGKGTILYEKEGRMLNKKVRSGDVIVIPRGAPHCFDARPGEIAHYAVVEFGPKIDYQKHHFNGKLMV